MNKIRNGVQLKNGNNRKINSRVKNNLKDGYQRIKLNLKFNVNNNNLNCQTSNNITNKTNSSNNPKKIIFIEPKLKHKIIYLYQIV